MVNFDKKETEHVISLLQAALNADPENALNKKLVARLEKSLKQIKPRSAKRKGLDWQKECCGMISRATGIAYAPQDDDGEIKSRESARPGVDIILRGEAARKFGWKVECKNAEAISLPEWIRQAWTNSGGKNDWLLLIKSRLLPMKKIAVMDFAKFEQISGILCRRENAEP